MGWTCDSNARSCAKNSFFSAMSYGTRRQGRPRLRWGDGVDQEAREGGPGSPRLERLKCKSERLEAHFCGGQDPYPGCKIIFETNLKY